ncbi:MAG: hypothetical protein UV09_C0012G0072 [Candidatus Gottesmanbacteria bacterium GW2011_GWA2_42_18]|uniref:Uncharacterized protein n=2 Tax=Candidatus Gottesmaniibacteriota TaxID=1752720 RepID=A0A0G1CB79_9BACT|nr:MAG: hypothetical protein UV09_C0012G0072 [Candidatus Gottesmanbacteria bacterium GW2011_GWA2_42_18]KKS76323.1 MAG: hypothetical protein UV46_C0004G0009 [Candidatus Gottesmanbacteria bacterium GW2011_GWC2_42_8]
MSGNYDKIIQINNIMVLTKRQVEEMAKFSLDISKLSLASLVLGLFSSELNLSKLIVAVWGLVIAALFFSLGMRLFKEVV